MQNPLLAQPLQNHFAEVKAEHIVPAIKSIINHNNQAIKQLLQQNDFSWQNLVQPIDELENDLEKVWTIIGQLNAVMNSEALQQGFETALQMITEYSTLWAQNLELYAAYEQVAQQADLDSKQQLILQHILRDFRLSGVTLEQEKKNKFAKLKQQNSNLCSRFKKNLLDATMAWSLLIDEQDAESKLKGLPKDVKEKLKANAESKQQKGYRITLDMPVYLAMMKNADDRQLRQQVYQAYAIRASELNPEQKELDNSQIMFELLQCKKEMADILQFNSFAELSLASKMAESSEQVFEFLYHLANASKKQGEQEIAELKQYAKETDNVADFQIWDLMYYSEKLRQQKFDIDTEALRAYFPEAKVLQGMFVIINKLYDVSFEIQPEAAVWQTDVKVYALKNNKNKIMAYIYFDLYAREHKSSGAWMNDFCTRLTTKTGEQKPIAFITCNFNSPTEDQPALFTHDEVLTLFHEMGHALHHVLTEVSYFHASGIRDVAWDAVELPSQFMENFCWQKQGLALISGHYETGEVLPEAMIEKLVSAKNFQSAIQMLRQLEFALFDFHIHHDYQINMEFNIQQQLDIVREKVSVLKPPAYNRFQHSFSHIFGGGYAAGYYGYKWAEVLACDVFSKFEEHGIFDKNIAQSFRDCILSQGGAVEAMDAFVAFMGRKPDVQALLRDSGIQ